MNIESGMYIDLFFIGMMLFSLIELILSHYFSMFFFNMGITVYKQSVDITNTDFNLLNGKVFKREEGKFKFIGDRIYFISRFFYFGFGRFDTPFPFKAVGVINFNKIDIKARIPLLTTALLCSFMISPVFSFIHLGSNEIAEGFNADILSSLIGFAPMAILLLICYFVEKHRMTKKIKELKSIIEEYE